MVRRVFFLSLFILEREREEKRTSTGMGRAEGEGERTSRRLHAENRANVGFNLMKLRSQPN